jgi:RNA polymerase sigma-70 factor (ECF subfamily)
MSYSYLRDYQEAEDVTSEVFLRFLKGFSDYGNKQHEKNFLLRTAINLSIDKLRKQKKKSLMSLLRKNLRAKRSMKRTRSCLTWWPRCRRWCYNF